ncbi:MAG: D-2-hydroxyacid dehydrogenase [Acidobacteriota bacterium]
MLDRSRNRRRIVTLGPLPAPVAARLGAYGEVVMTPEDGVEAFEILDDSVILLIPRGSVYIDGRWMDRAPGLKAIARTGVGYDSVSIEDATRRGIPVLYTPGAMSRAVAEQTLAFMLAAGKKLQFWRQSLAEGNWSARYTSRSWDFEGRVLGIIGYGRIGRLVRQLCRPLNMVVLADDPYIDHAAYGDDQVEFTSLEDVLQRASVITLHVPLTNETRAMINRTNIRLVQPGSLLINTARGAVIEDLDLLVEALDEGRLEAVALDVFPDEPPDLSHPLFRHPRAIVTGHVAARTPLAQQRILETMLEDACAVLEGRRPNLDNVVNPEVYLQGAVQQKR